MYLSFKRFLASNNYFWKYRHLIQKNIFKKSYGILPTNHFKKVFKKKKIISVLDFGCATGDKLEYFVSRDAKYIFGIDINKKAIHTCKKKFRYNKIFKNFDVSLTEKKLSEFLKKSKLKIFDLAILDRVCYILDLNDLNNILRIICKNSKYIYIDDFFYNKKSLKLRKNLFGYNHTNFDLIFKKFKFKKIFYGKSPYKKVLNSNVKSALFRNQSF
ncbi:methyltransferase domain-containing protein [Candidatus Pelagibacter sp. HIMB1623]|uniref:methyltransferase domain-containing protein n=1 Tax=Candidatus Pelagibacter sp. HIMB1623 TaxID=3413358 RepID=UPI003F835692